MQPNCRHDKDDVIGDHGQAVVKPADGTNRYRSLWRDRHKRRSDSSADPGLHECHARPSFVDIDAEPRCDRGRDAFNRMAGGQIRLASVDANHRRRL